MSDIKIVIDDPVKRLEGKPETEIPSDTSIRYEIDGNQFEIKIDPNNRALKVYRPGHQSITIESHTSNTIFIK